MVFNKFFSRKNWRILVEPGVRCGLAAMVLAWLFAFAPVAYGQGQALDAIVATVDSQVISESQLRQQVALIRFEAEQAGQNFPSASQLRQEAIDTLINIEVQTQFAQRNGINIDPQAIDLAIFDIAQSNNLTVEQLMQLLEQSAVEFEFFRDVVHDRLVIRRLIDEVLTPTIRIDDGAIEAYLRKFADEFESVDEFNISVIVFNLPVGVAADEKRELRQIVDEIVSDLTSGGIGFDELKESISEYEGVETGDLGWNRLSSLNPVIVDVLRTLRIGQTSGTLDLENSFLIVRLNDMRRTSNADAVSQRMYRLRQILLTDNATASQENTAVERLNELREKILAGEDFAQLARIHTENRDARQNGGDLGWLSEGDLPGQFVTMFDGMEIGDITQAISYADQYFLFELIGRRMSDASENRRAYVRNLLRNRRLNQEHIDWVVSLRDQAMVEYRTRL